MSNRPFVCPYCDRPHRTLKGVLSCHPAQVRRATEGVESNAMLITLLSGIDARRRAALFGILPEASPTDRVA